MTIIIKTSAGSYWLNVISFRVCDDVVSAVNLHHISRRWRMMSSQMLFSSSRDVLKDSFRPFLTIRLPPNTLM